MYQIPISEIKAPAYIYKNGNCIFVKDNIKVSKTTSRSDIATSNAIKAGDIITANTIEIKYTPTAFSNSDDLFLPLKLVKGSRLPTIDDCYIIARTDSSTWVKWAFSKCVHDTVGSITFGSDSPMGEHGMTVYCDPTDSSVPLVTCTTLTTAPTLPTMTTTDAFLLRCIGVYGTGSSAIDFDTDGASIEISIETEDAKCDRLMVFGKNLTDIKITAKLKPLNLEYSDWLTLTGINKTEALGTFTGVSTLSDLVLRGDASGDFQFTLKSARLSNPSATFGANDKLMDEVSFEALGDSFGDNKLAIATTTADFEYTEVDSDE